MRILIADDEALARKKLKRFLAEIHPSPVIVEAGDGLETLDCLESMKPDLVFLDIQMPGMTGLEVIEAFGVEEMPPVIFTTAYDQYAIKAFEHNAIDYLLKPFDEERFAKAFKRFEDRSGKPSEAESALLSRLVEQVRSKDCLERIMVRQNDRIVPVSVSNILWFEADDKYIRVHAENAKFYIRNTIANLANRLDPKKFVRAHRSAIVNLDFIQELESLTHGDYQILLKNGDSLTLSRRYSSAVKEYLIG